jgi:hypothetical protein
MKEKAGEVFSIAKDNDLNRGSKVSHLLEGRFIFIVEM